MGWGYSLHLVDDQPEAVAHVDDGSIEGGAGGGVEDQSDRIGLSADAERVDFAGRFAIGDGLADLQHVSAENEVIAGSKW